MGFFLSEHTATLAGLEKEESYTVEPKPSMTAKEINDVLTETSLKIKSIELQTNEVIDGKHLPDIVGHVKGYGDTDLYVGNECIEHENIRDIDFR